MRWLALALVLASTTAHADDVVFARGGPKSEPAKQTVIAAIAALRGDMAPCWRRSASAADVAITTGADGAVTSAAARSDGPIAQCVAGLLAVATLPRSAGAWSGVVTIAPISSGGSSDDVGALLGKHQPELRACQQADDKATGIVEIDLRVHPDGSISDLAVSRSLSSALDACLVKALAKMKLDGYRGKEVRYRLGLSFNAGSAGGGGGAPAPPTDATPAPTKRGPLSVDQMQPVIEADRVHIDRCGAGVKATGDLVIRFTVRKDGTTKNLGVKTSLGDAKVEACVLDRFAKLRFPPATDETQVQFPLHFVAR
jgi:TonB family protein